MKKYQVIGPFDGWKWFGESDRLNSAKRIATREAVNEGCAFGPRKPDVYLGEDVIDGPCARVPAPWAKPVARWMSYTAQWEDW